MPFDTSPRRSLTKQQWDYAFRIARLERSVAVIGCTGNWLATCYARSIIAPGVNHRCLDGYWESGGVARVGDTDTDPRKVFPAYVNTIYGRESRQRRAMNYNDPT